MRADNKKPIDVAVVTTSVVKPIIHLSYILDSSGSMHMAGENKYKVALDSIKSDIKEFSVSKEANYTFTLVEFSDSAVTHFYKSTDVRTINAMLEKCRLFNGSTALNDTIISTLTRLKGDIKHGEANIVNILTDGGENTSTVRNKKVVHALIDVCKVVGMTITFIGTKFDVQDIITNYGVISTNTVMYNNTAADLERVTKMRTSSISNFSKKMRGGASGQSLTADFFSEEK